MRFAATVVVVLASSPALADPSVVANLGVDYQSENRGGADEDHSAAMSIDVAVGGAFADRITLSGFARLRFLTSNDDGNFSNDNGQGWLGARVDVAATSSLIAGAGIAVIGFRHDFNHESDDYNWGMGVEAHVGYAIRPTSSSFAIEPRLEIGRTDANPGIGTVYGRASVGLRW